MMRESGFDYCVIGTDAAYINSFVERFYATIQGDALLDPNFAAKITGWSAAARE